MILSKRISIRDYAKVVNLRHRLARSRGWVNCGKIDRLEAQRMGDQYLITIEGSGNHDFKRVIDALI